MIVLVTEQRQVLVNALLVVLFNKGIKYRHWPSSGTVAGVKRRTGRYLYIAQLDVRNRAAIEEMLACSLPSGAILISW